MNTLQAIIQTVIPEEAIQNPKTKSSMEPKSCSECCGETRYISAYCIVPGLFCDLSFIKILQLDVCEHLI